MQAFPSVEERRSWVEDLQEAAQLLPLTVPEVRRLLSRLVWQASLKTSVSWPCHIGAGDMRLEPNDLISNVAPFG